MKYFALLAPLALMMPSMAQANSCGTALTGPCPSVPEISAVGAVAALAVVAAGIALIRERSK